MMIQYKTFNEVFQNPQSLLNLLNIFTDSKPKEMFSNINWFMDFDTKILPRIYEVFLSKSYNKIFIWQDNGTTELNELNIGINGQFIPLLWTNILNFYKEQLILLNNDLNQLKDWKNRGSSSSSINQSADTGYNQPAISGFKWDRTKDAPTSKRVNQNDQNIVNKLSDIANLVNTRINIYFTDIFYQFEYMFLNKSWVRC